MLAPHDLGLVGEIPGYSFTKFLLGTEHLPDFYQIKNEVKGMGEVLG